MRKILVPCDGSENALRAVRYAASFAKMLPDVRVELLNVQDPVLLREHAALSAQDIAKMQADDADRLLQSARQILEAEGVPFHASHRTGSPANEIARHAEETHCDAIIMGTRGFGPIASIVIGSVATRVIHLAAIPVTLVK